jgi:trans-aconitate methyltransferase
VSSEHYFDRVAFDYIGQSQSWVWRLIRRRESAAVLANLRQIGKESKVLEIGCGAGFYTHQILQNEVGQVTAVDASSAMLSQISDQPKLSKVRADWRDFHSAQIYDVVLCAGALEFSGDHRLFFERAAEWLKPCGRLVLLFPPESIGGFCYKLYHSMNDVAVTLFNARNLAMQAERFNLKLESETEVWPLAFVHRYRKSAL